MACTLTHEPLHAHQTSRVSTASQLTQEKREKTTTLLQASCTVIIVNYSQISSPISRWFSQSLLANSATGTRIFQCKKEPPESYLNPVSWASPKRTSPLKGTNSAKLRTAQLVASFIALPESAKTNPSFLTDKVLVTTYETPVDESGEADQDEDSLKKTQEFIIADNKDNEMAVDKGKFKMRENKITDLTQ